VTRLATSLHPNLTQALGRVGSQLWTNYVRGSVEGLSAVMFVLAIVGNVTYLGAILVGDAKISAG
jgi:hypothetical protein